ncbi:MAG: hypothetical protein JWR74_2809 [Polaromonas sp.]|nr:hypothetical protein [Polaromonas sp.]
MTMMYCHACGKQLAAAAPFCPHCSAPQTVASVSATPVTPGAPAAQAFSASAQRAPQTFTDYAQVPWFQRRWFLLVAFVFLSPVAALLAATGEVYYQGSDGAVKRMADSIKNFKLSLFFFSGAFVFGLLVTQSLASNLIYAAITLVMALVWGLKK